jgi:hypothetical protein
LTEEIAPLDQLPHQDAKPNFNLIEPKVMLGREGIAHIGMNHRPLGDIKTGNLKFECRDEYTQTLGGRSDPDAFPTPHFQESSDILKADLPTLGC